MSFPSKSEREKCWASRDELWKCLDETNKNKDSDPSKVCAQFRALYESSCPSQWVKHFDRKREYLRFKDRIQNDGLKMICWLCKDSRVPEDSHSDASEAELGNGNTSTIRTRINSHDGRGESESSCSTLPTEPIPTSHLNSSTSSQKCPSPNTRIYRKFQPPPPPTFT